MEKPECEQLLSVLSIIQQDMHELKYKYMRISVDDTNRLDKQLQAIQIRLMVLETILKKHFGNDFLANSNVVKKSYSYEQKIS